MNARIVIAAVIAAVTVFASANAQTVAAPRPTPASTFGTEATPLTPTMTPAMAVAYPERTMVPPSADPELPMTLENMVAATLALAEADAQVQAQSSSAQSQRAITPESTLPSKITPVTPVSTPTATPERTMVPPQQQEKAAVGTLDRTMVPPMAH